jgi:hypothetical protein
MGKLRKPARRVQPSVLGRCVTAFEPENGVSAMEVRGYRLVGWTTEGYPIFESVTGPVVESQLVYETPLFEEFIPETFH